MKIRYVGKQPTLVLVSKGNPKIDVKPKQVFECDPDCSKNLLSYQGLFQRVVSKDEKNIEKKAKARVKDEIEQHKQSLEERKVKIQDMRTELIENYTMDQDKIDKMGELELETLYKETKAKENLGFKDEVDPQLIAKVIKKIQKAKDLDALGEFNYENEELKEAIDKRRAELEKEKDDTEFVNHTLTKEDLEKNPDLEAQGYKVGDLVSIPKETPIKDFFKKLIGKK